MRRQRLELYALPDYVPRKNRSNDYGFDPHEQEHATFTGMGADINVHDQWACESMGAIQDRTKEHLGQSDKGISAYRRILREAMDRTGRRQAADGAGRGGSRAHHRPGHGRRHRPDRRLAGLLEVDRREQAQGGGLGGASEQRHAPERRNAPERPLMSARDKRSVSFVERHGLWSDEQAKAAEAVEQAVADQGLDRVRFSFVDQHGILRGKTMVAAEAAVTMRNGCTATSTLLAKDTAHRTVFPVFTPGGGFGMPEMEGAADMLLVADRRPFASCHGRTRPAGSCATSTFPTASR